MGVFYIFFVDFWGFSYFYGFHGFLLKGSASVYNGAVFRVYCLGWRSNRQKNQKINVKRSIAPPNILVAVLVK